MQGSVADDHINSNYSANEIITNQSNQGIEPCSLSDHYFNTHRGTLYIRVGPMFSGKTTWLNGELTQLADKGFSVLKISHSDDIRTNVINGDDCGSTHNSSYKFLSEKITR